MAPNQAIKRAGDVNLPEDVLVNVGPDENVLVVDGCLEVDQLALDNTFLERQFHLEDDVRGLHIRGDLFVNGDLVNNELDFGPFLSVSGALSATNAWLGGSVVHVSGATTIEKTLATKYNHGSFSGVGPLSVPFFAAGDHRIRLGTEPECRLLVGCAWSISAPTSPLEWDFFFPLKNEPRACQLAAMRSLHPDLFDWSEWNEWTEEERTELNSEFELLFSFDDRKLDAWLTKGQCVWRGDADWPVQVVGGENSSAPS